VRARSGALLGLLLSPALAGCGSSEQPVRTIVERTATQTRTVTVPAAPAPAATRVVRVPHTQSEEPPPAPISGYIAQLGSFQYRDNAERYAADFRARGLHAAILRSDSYRELVPGYWVVYVGFFADAAEAEAIARQGRALGSPGAFVRAASYDMTR
jgi:cell division septation protein DedD